MNVSYEWLRQYVATDLPCREAAQALSRVGLNVDDITDLEGGDARLLVEVTSNRPDCLGHLGVGRELAAALGLALRRPDPACAESDERAADAVAVEIEDLALCPLYTARLVRGVKVGPSPQWLRRRLEAVGIRPINNVVDVTNYVMMECGQPLHAFDFRWIDQGRIVVRRAVHGERFFAIDHSEHTLTPDRLVIADAKRPVALAGVMGGADTEIAAETRDVLLEAAVFDPLSIRTTARSLGLASESSYRFERRVDPGTTDWASRRACQLILETAGGRAAAGVVAVGRPMPDPRELVLRVPRIRTVLGLDMAGPAAADILRRLEIEVLEAGPDRLRVRIPSWRPDLQREADLIEEVARHHGYEKIPESRHVPLAYAARSKAERVRETVGQVLTAAGYFEAITFTFTSRARAVRMRPPDVTGEPLVCRGTPLAVRQSVLPGLLDSLRVNRHVGETDARLFEVAKRFLPVEGQELPREETMLALAGPDDFHAVRGALEAVFEALRLGPRVGFAPSDRYRDLDPGAAAEVLLDGRPIGMLGRASPDAAREFDLDDPPTVAEVSYERLVAEADLTPTFRPLPQVPAIWRDLALVVDETVPWDRIARAVAGARVAELESVEPLDVYRGKQVPPGKKSVAVRLVLRASAGTLTHEQADARVARILASLAEGIGAVLRT